MRLPILSTPPARITRAALAAGCLILLNGCSWIGQGWLQGHQSTFDPAGPVAQRQLDLFLLICKVVAVLFVLVGGTLAYATLKFKARGEAEEKLEVESQGHGNPLIELGLIGLSVGVLVIIAVPTLKGIWYLDEIPLDQKANAYEVTATGYQWWFKFQYPKEIAQTIDAATGKLTSAGPLTTANELVIPAGRPVLINLRTMDVIHSFWIPKLAGKVDMMPNRANHLWLQADKPGYFWGQCAEFCGDSHAVMRFRVIALDAREFQAWVDAQTQPARVIGSAADAAAAASAPATASFAAFHTYATNEKGYTDRYELVEPLTAWREKQAPEKDENPALVAQGRALFQGKSCIACHTIRGLQGAAGVIGPELTHVGARSTIAAGLLENNADQLHRWINNPGAVKPGNKMWVLGYTAMAIHLTEADQTALVAYLQSLK